MNPEILIKLAWLLIIRPIIRVMINDPNSDADEQMMAEADKVFKELFK